MTIIKKEISNKCYKCSGTGFGKLDETECSVCKGTGIWKEEIYYFIDKKNKIAISGDTLK